MIDPTSGERKRLTGDVDAHATTPTWSPTGRQIACAVSASGVSMIYVRDLATNRHWAITAIQASSPSWRPP